MWYVHARTHSDTHIHAHICTRTCAHSLQGNTSPGCVCVGGGAEVLFYTLLNDGNFPRACSDESAVPPGRRGALCSAPHTGHPPVLLPTSQDLPSGPWVWGSQAPRLRNLRDHLHPSLPPHPHPHPQERGSQRRGENIHLRIYYNTFFSKYKRRDRTGAGSVAALGEGGLGGAGSPVQRDREPWWGDLPPLLRWTFQQIIGGGRVHSEATPRPGHQRGGRVAGRGRQGED